MKQSATHHCNHGRFGQASHFALRTLLCLLAIGVAAIACGWYGPINSVRFNGFYSYEDFYRLPPLPRALDAATGLPPQPAEAIVDYVEEEEKTKERELEIERAWAAAAQAEAQTRWLDLQRHLETWLKLDVAAQARRNSALDRLDALQSLAQGASTKGLQAYLAARKQYDAQAGASTAPEPVSDLLAAVPHEPALQDNVAYLRAALLYRTDDFPAAAQQFARLAVKHPRSEKRAAALFMSGVALMKSSCSMLGREAYGSGDLFNYSANAQPAVKPEPCVDAAWRAALRTFQLYQQRYPQGRYTSDARGWIAYLHLRVGERGAALIEYYRMLADERNLAGRLEAALSLRMIRGRATAAELAQVERVLSNEPAAALAYAYHNLYNYAIYYECELAGKGYFASDDYEGEARALEQKRRRLADVERKRIVAFATQMLRRYPQTALRGAFTLRLAQANLELGENQAARECATQALSAGLRGEQRKQALWVKGAAEQRLNDYPAARQSFNALIAEDNGGQLTEGARRLLALAAEDAGDYDTALEQYLTLGYDSDTAYFIDMLLAPAQLASFIEQHPQHAKRAELVYALGLRYLRDGHWDEARAMLTGLKTSACSTWESRYYGIYGEQTDPKLALNPRAGGVCAEWVLRDLKTIDDLERLERKVGLLVDDESKAEALYQLASYQYEGGTMLFYNPAAWNGQRYFLLSALAEGESYRAPNEAQRLFEAAQNHDALARSLKIYLDIYQRFPQTRAAREALYTAAICHERLAEMNNYWRGIYNQKLHAGNQLVTYADVKKAYPGYQLPRGTWGWQPATRTVNGGPGWQAPPKAAPRPSRWKRAEMKLARFWQAAQSEANQAWETQVWPMLVWLFYALCTLVLGYAVLVAVLWRKQHAAGGAASEVIKLNLQTEPAELANGASVVERIINKE